MPHNTTLKAKYFDRIERLRRRAEYLRNRIAKLESKDLRSLAYDKGELSALEWAIPLLEDHMINWTIQRMPAETRAKFGWAAHPELDTPTTFGFKEVPEE